MAWSNFPLQDLDPPSPGRPHQSFITVWLSFSISYSILIISLSYSFNPKEHLSPRPWQRRRWRLLFLRAALLFYLVGGSVCASTLTLTSASVASNWQDDIDPNNVTKARFSSWCLCVYTCLAICTSDIQFQGDTVTLVSITQCQEHHWHWSMKWAVEGSILYRQSSRQDCTNQI